MTHWAMGLFFLVSVAAAYPIVAANTENEAETLKRIAPFQGIVGVMGLVWGLLGFSALDGLSTMGTVILAVEVVMGALMGYVWISETFLERDVTEMRAKTEVVLIPLGVLGVALASLWIAVLGIA